jgi:formylglycine-generating enzyme required for sulfatase activity
VGLKVGTTFKTEANKKGLAVWQKLLIAFVLGTIVWDWAQADSGAYDVGAAVEKAIPGVDQGENRRVALVIGNADYRDGAFQNPINDARLMSKTLGLLGFEVMVYENATQQRMKEAMREFGQRLNAGGVGLLYFAGHGFRIGDQTLLAPVDSDSHSPGRLIATGIDLKSVLASMSAPRPGKRNLIILDTCLNNPFHTGSERSFDLPDQTLIAYATAPGSFAADGARHGLYTAELARALALPGRDIEEVLASVGSAVSQATDHRQIPWVSSSLSGEFRLETITASARVLPSPEPEVVVAMQSRGILPKDSAYELAFWESIKDSTHISDYEAYLDAYPNGRFAALARARIERLRPAAPKSETPEKARPAPVPEAAPKPTPPPPAKASEPVRPAAAPPASPEKPPGPPATVTEIKDCPMCPTLVGLPRGAYTMGSNSDDPSERPAHGVSLSGPFAIGKYEVTVEQWNACVDAGACQRVSTDPNRTANTPVRDVSWDDAQQYVAWLSKVSGKAYRLPTEAEWEYAERGGTSSRYWWGEQMRNGNANCKGCGEPWRQDGPANVGSFAANAYGLYDMNGSVWEWVSDCWHNSYKGAPSDGRSWDEHDCRVRVIRGGSWRDGPSYMVSSTRFKYDASVRYSQNGFRVARSLK